MADQEIRQLTEQTVVDDTDNIAIQDGLTDENKRLEALTLKDYVLDDSSYRELARTTLSGAGDTLSVASIPARKYLRVVFHIIPSGQIDADLRFNNDSGSNYALRLSANGAAEVTGTAGSSIGLFTNVSTQILVTMDIINVETRNKLFYASIVGQNTAGAGAVPDRREYVGKWANTTAQINRIDIVNADTGDLAIGSEIIVLGHD